MHNMILFVIVINILLFPGILEEECVCRYSRPPTQYCLRFLEDGLGTEFTMHHHAYQCYGERKGTFFLYCTYPKSGMFRVQNISCDNFSC